MDNELKSVKLKSRLIGKSFFKVEDQKINADKVKYYSDGENFYANLKSVILAKGAFGIRISEGKINLYEKTVNSQMHMADTNALPSGMPGVGVSHFSHSSMSLSNNFYYYSLGFGPIKKVIYKDLSIQMQGDIESMNYLNKYKRRSTITTVSKIVSVLVSVGSIVSIMHKTDGGNRKQPHSNLTVEYIGLGAASGFSILGLIMNSGKENILREAVIEYNK